MYRLRRQLKFKKLYSSDEVPESPRLAIKSLLRPAVTNVHFKCNKLCYTQSDGLAMGSSLGVIWQICGWNPLKNLCRNQKREGRAKLMTQRWYALTVTNALLSEGMESSANHAKTGFMQNAKVSLTQNIRTCRKLFGSVSIVQKKVEKRTHWNWNYSRGMWMT